MLHYVSENICISMLICMILFITLIVHYAVLLGGLIILQQVADEKMVIKGK